MLRSRSHRHIGKILSAQYKRFAVATCTQINPHGRQENAAVLAACRYVHASSTSFRPETQSALAATDAIFSSNPLEFKPSANILDLEGLFTASELEELNEELALLQQAHGVQCVVATVPTAGPMPPKTMATHIFNAWGIGSPLFNDGLLILLSTKERWW